MITVVKPGLQTTVQDLPGRTGYWGVGVPPSGAWDATAAALANRAVGNDPGAAGLECLVTGPTLRFDAAAVVVLAGAVVNATVDGEPVAAGVPVEVPAGGTLAVGRCGAPGIRVYVAVAGGIDVPAVLGSRSTFVLGGFGGHEGRALKAGDELALGSPTGPPVDVSAELPELGTAWELEVVPGPHGAPDHLTAEGVAEFFGATWTVDHRADRTGIRLVGPKPQWARTDGGDAGLHPSNLHDSAYPVGGIMVSGDTPVIVGQDGPSLGGFVVAAVVTTRDRWKLAQLRPGDTVRLAPVETPLLLGELEADQHRPALSVRAAGDAHLLLEAGPAALDLGVRLWVHLLAEALQAQENQAVLELVEGVRSLLVKVDPGLLPLQDAADLVLKLARDVADPAAVELPVREVLLPIALDHPQAHEAMARYARSVRPDAPWCPDNVEFIRRINDLGGRDDVFGIVTAATYLVVGLGDVYLGAPVAVPLDPRHRLVTTKYDPPRTWTPQNAVGIGGVYLCVYGMEGPGGYQLVGRTVPVWDLAAETPWLLRPFDRLRFVPVSDEELDALRAAPPPLTTRPATFSLAEVRALEEEHAAEIAAFTAKRTAGFEAERDRWNR